MKILSALLLLTSSVLVNAYSNCTGCKVISEEEGQKWGVENNQWCIIVPANCDPNDANNKCFSFPDYACCRGNTVVETDSAGKWGVENGYWCGIKDSAPAGGNETAPATGGQQQPAPQPEQPQQPAEPAKPAYNYNPAVSFKEAPGNYLNPCPKPGKVVKESYKIGNGQNTLNVLLPNGYDEKKQYNIFYLMHGGGENENTIFSNDVKLNNIIDNMIMNGDLEPLIIVTPTFNKCEARTFYKELREYVIPFVEGKYSTYAKSTSPEDIKASRMHRAFGGFSMGSASTWAVLLNCLDIVGYYMPLSGDNWEANDNKAKATTVADAIKKAGLEKNQFIIFAATGSDDMAYQRMKPQMDLMKNMEPFVYTSDFSKGNFYFLVAPGKTHWWGYVRHYIYDALPSFFHEG